MSKLKKALKAIGEIIKNPMLLNNVLNDDSVWGKYLTKKYNLKNGLGVVDINDVCPNMNETLENFAFLDGSSLPTDMALLKALSRKFDKCKYFEIGTWRGESVSNVASVASECYTLNLSKKEMLALGMQEKYADLHGFFSKSKNNIKHLTGDSKTFNFAGLKTKFDLIFIDGNHHYDYVKADTENIFKHLVHENTIVVWHDYAFNPEKIRPEVIAGILDGTPSKFHKHLYHVSNSLCAIYINGKFNTNTIKPPTTPTKAFNLKVETKIINQ